MTAIAIVRGEDAIVIASDGAAYDGEGRLRQIVPKVGLYPHLSCAIAGRGSQLLPTYFQWELFWTPNPPVDFDGLIEIAEQLTRAAMDRVKFDSPPSTWKSTLFLCGYSIGRSRMETYAIKSMEWEGVPQADGSLRTVAPFTLVPLPTIHLAPAPEPPIAARFGIVIPAEMTELPEDGAIYAMRAVAACRFCPGNSSEDLAESNPFTCVGGFLQVTYVGRAGASSEVVHRWPDAIGERMDPAQGEPHEIVPAWLMPDRGTR